ncbi:MAG: hypothetical protein QF735_13975, partial [Phycisphaeraceae bacterium]|nr:hypothetical protein [Phycisphaeraceae bacterium]
MAIDAGVFNPAACGRIAVQALRLNGYNDAWTTAHNISHAHLLNSCHVEKTHIPPHAIALPVARVHNAGRRYVDRLPASVVYRW